MTSTQRILASLVVSGLLVACGSSKASESAPDSEYAGEVTDTSTDTGSAAPQIPLEFHGYECTVDCSGHEAGYDWAERHDIDDEDDCGGNSESFIEGCKAYVHDTETSTDDNGDDGSDG